MRCILVLINETCCDFRWVNFFDFIENLIQFEVLRSDVQGGYKLILGLSKIIY